MNLREFLHGCPLKLSALDQTNYPLKLLPEIPDQAVVTEYFYRNHFTQKIMFYFFTILKIIFVMGLMTDFPIRIKGTLFSCSMGKLSLTFYIAIEIKIKPLSSKKTFQVLPLNL